PGAGTGGAFVPSPDGVTWQKRSAGTSATLLAAANGPSSDVGFVAVGETTSGVIYTTHDPTDGSAFTVRASSLPLLHAVTATLSGPKLIAAGVEGAIYTSDDGVQWAPHPVDNGSVSFNAVAQCRGYLAVGQVGSGPTAHGVLASSSDGFTWTVEHLVGVGGLNAIACRGTVTLLLRHRPTLP